jgi:hypothetical protein
MRAAQQHDAAADEQEGQQRAAFARAEARVPRINSAVQAATSSTAGQFTGPTACRPNRLSA